METVTTRARGITVSVDCGVGHLADLAIETEGRTLKPLHRAPWLDEPPESLPPGLPDGVTRLSGDFLCAPFSAADVEAAPLHGWTAPGTSSKAPPSRKDGGHGSGLSVR